jgi:hypothetical protein
MKTAPLLNPIAGPLVKYKEPLSPPEEVPEPIKTDPLAPVLAVPVLRTRKPLTPLAPELAVCKVTAPLDVRDP